MNDQIDLEVLQVGIQTLISDSFANDVKVGVERRPELVATMASAFLKMPGQRFELVTISYPADWWQGVKERWLPDWALRRWPARHTSTTFNPSIYYPLVKLPNEDNFLYIERHDRSVS